MAEVATKKSISVVSNKKNEVCGVQSNNGLLDLDNLTASNNQLISLCETNDDEDDLILTNNTRNELDTDDKSLQELIESELALRISSNAEQDTVVETDHEEDEPSTNQPETVMRIVLDRRQDTFDMNTEFIVMETEHCSLIEEPYSYQNGHVSPDTKITGSSYGENAQPEPILADFREEEEEEQVFAEEPEVGGAIVIQKTDADEVDQPARDDGRLFQRSQDEETSSCPVDDPASRAPDAEDRPSEMPHLVEESVQDVLSDQVTSATPVTCVDKYEEEEEEVSAKVVEGADLLQTETAFGGDLSRDTSDTWSEQVTFQEGQQAGQFSDNFDQTLCQQSPESCTARELEDSSSLIQSDKPDDPFEPVMPETGKEEDVADMNELPVEEESKVSLDDKSSSSVDEKIPEDPEDCSIPERPIEEIEELVQAATTAESRSFDDVTLSNSDASTDAASTQEFIDTERRVLSEENDAERLQDEVQGFEGLSSEKSEPPLQSSMDEDELAREEEVKEEANDNADEQNAIAESSSELSVSEPTFIEKTEAVASDGNATIFSDTKCPETGPDSDLIEE
ncbi:uncharacterized protein LOC144477432, partial [Augochlora pura]